MSIRKNYFYNTINQLLTMLVAIVTVPCVSRVLGVENIGIYSYTYSIVTYFVMFVTLGINNYGNREIAKVQNERDRLNKTFSNIYAMQFMIGIIVLIAYILYIIICVNRYKYLFIIEIIYIVAAIIDINWAMYGLEVFRFLAIRNTIISTINLIFILVAVKDESSLYIYTFILAGGALINQITAWCYIKRKIQFESISLVEIRRHIKPNLILFIPILAVSLYKIMDKIMLGNMVGISHVGFFEVSEKIIRVPTILISSLGIVMLPRMSNLYANSNASTGNFYIKKSIDIAMILSSSLCFGIMAISKEFVPLFYGVGYDTCVYIYLVLLPSCVFLAFSNVIRTQFLIPTGRDWVYIKAVIIGAIVNISINLLIIPELYSIGAAIGTITAEAAVCISQAIDIRKDLPIGDYVKRSIPFVMLGMVMFGCIYPININAHLLVVFMIKSVLGCIIYTIGLLLILYFKRSVYQINIISIIKALKNAK